MERLKNNKMKKRAMMKKMVIAAIIAGILGGSTPNVFADNVQSINQSTEKISDSSFYISTKDAINQTGNYIYNKNKNPNYGSEWNIIGLSRSEVNISNSYYQEYYNNVVETLKGSNGELNNPTDYSRLILGITAIGKNASNVEGYNLIEKLSDFNYIKGQGLNSLVFALIAIDSNQYNIPEVNGEKVQTTRDMIINEILSMEISTGGWAFFGSKADVDMTAMILQALAKYKNDDRVKPAIDRGIDLLSKLQNKNGGYESWGSYNCENIAQVVVALTELGINPKTDERFIKDKSLVDSMMEFYVDGGGFKHVLSENKPNSMATEQGMYALVAYERFINGKNSLYNMSDSILNYNFINKSKNVVNL